MNDLLLCSRNPGKNKRTSLVTIALPLTGRPFLEGWVTHSEIIAGTEWIIRWRYNITVVNLPRCLIAPFLFIMIHPLRLWVSTSRSARTAKDIIELCESVSNYEKSHRKNCLPSNFPVSLEGVGVWPLHLYHLKYMTEQKCWVRYKSQQRTCLFHG